MKKKIFLTSLMMYCFNNYNLGFFCNLFNNSDNKKTVFYLGSVLTVISGGIMWWQKDKPASNVSDFMICSAGCALVLGIASILHSRGCHYQDDL